MNTTTMSAAHAMARRLDAIGSLYKCLPAGHPGRATLQAQNVLLTRRFNAYVAANC